MATKNINGIVLGDYPIGDDGKIIIVFSIEYGKIALKALGVNKIISKNKFSTQTFSQSNFEIFKSNFPDRLSKLKTGELLKSNIKISRNYQNYLYASSISQIIDKAFDFGIKNVQAFKMIEHCINSLSDDLHPLHYFSLFMFYSLDWFGARWNLNQCGVCNKKSDFMMDFDYTKYSLICRKCKSNDTLFVKTTFLKLILQLNNSNYFDIKNIEDLQIKDIIFLSVILMEYINSEIGIFITGIEIIKNQNVFQNLNFL
ncbi:DNA repair protein recO [Spiroplasma sabaudiense Ar-1343]|uniref:DNA repair protein RecO n=1 Tax=Spiroplasma sabaudiense Ar-1343 TaxID=1276257 RepID=W6A9P5_9MOLU|nr:DNA repair protein RecO [Spiroplasma sabaudiense]AHI53732.1 DNA repair protein recO [Spiroplasma sabaudiense Ar-1343]